MASQEFVEGNGITKAIHPPHSPNFTPLDCYLFRCVEPPVKSLCQPADKLSSVLKVILSDLEKSGSQAPSLSSMKKFDRHNGTNDDSIQ
jgi:hypothetical protein